MSKAKQIILAQSRLGRIKLHLLTLLRDHHITFHMSGILREIKGV
jgi:hypothetical protein